MPNKKTTFCADTSKLSDVEKKIMASSMKAGQEQINIIRAAQAKNNTAKETPKEEPEE